jgi:hypothetical protein
MDLIAIAISCFVGVLGTWIKLTNEVTKIKARLYSLEKQEGEVKEMLKELCQGMQDIKLLLAEKGIK